MSDHRYILNVPDLKLFRQLVEDNPHWKRILNVSKTLQLIQELWAIRQQMCQHCQQQKTSCLVMADSNDGIIVTYDEKVTR